MGLAYQMCMLAVHPGVQYARLDTGEVPDHQIEPGKHFLAKCRRAPQLHEHLVPSCQRILELRL